jgi:hypothetical protein
MREQKTTKDCLHELSAVAVACSHTIAEQSTVTWALTTGACWFDCVQISAYDHVYCLEYVWVSPLAPGVPGWLVAPEFGVVAVNVPAVFIASPLVGVV